MSTLNGQASNQQIERIRELARSKDTTNYPGNKNDLSSSFIGAKDAEYMICDLERLPDAAPTVRKDKSPINIGDSVKTEDGEIGTVTGIRFADKKKKTKIIEFTIDGTETSTFECNLEKI